MDSYDHFLDATPGRIGPQGLMDTGLLGLGPSGLAHMQGLTIGTVEHRRDPALAGKRRAQPRPTLVDAVGGELEAARAQELIEQMGEAGLPI